MGKMQVTKKEVKICKHYSQLYKIPSTKIRIDTNGRAYVWQSGVKLYMYTRTIKPPTKEIFDEEDVDGNVVRQASLQPISEITADDFDTEYEQEAAEQFARELKERLEDAEENQKGLKTDNSVVRNLESDLASVRTQKSTEGRESIRTQPESDEDKEHNTKTSQHLSEDLKLLRQLANADEETRYLMGETGVEELSAAYSKN